MGRDFGIVELGILAFLFWVVIVYWLEVLACREEDKVMGRRRKNRHRKARKAKANKTKIKKNKDKKRPLIPLTVEDRGEMLEIELKQLELNDLDEQEHKANTVEKRQGFWKIHQGKN